MTFKDDDTKRYFCNEKGFSTYGTFFKYWGGWITAAHVMEEMNFILPPFIKNSQKSNIIHRPGGMDISLIGCTDIQKPSISLIDGDNITAWGYPAGSLHMTYRNGKVYLRRDAFSWIMDIDHPNEPVVVGMSGGPIVASLNGNLECFGVLVTRNHPHDLDQDGKIDHNCDFVLLEDVYNLLKGGV